MCLNFLFLKFRLIQCEGLMVVLGLWLSLIDTEKLLESALVEKILEVLSRLSFSVDLLVKYKFGRVIKKIAQQKVSPKMKPINLEMASKLFEDWSELANKPETPSISRKKSDDSTTNGFEIVTPPAAPILEPIDNTNANVTTKTALKRSSPNLKADQVKRAKLNVKKNVKFHEDLCKVIIFERAPEEYEYLSDGSAARDSYLHADKGEALAAFNHSNDSDESLDSLSFILKPWKQLVELEEIPRDRPDGIDSEENIIQHQRERSVLSINYFSIHEVTFSPSEGDVDDISSDDVPHYKTIPIRSNETIVKHSFNFKSVKNLEISSLFIPEMMNQFVPSSSTYNDLLNPFSNVKTPIILETIPPSIIPRDGPIYDPYKYSAFSSTATKFDPTKNSSLHQTSPPYISRDEPIYDSYKYSAAFSRFDPARNSSRPLPTKSRRESEEAPVSGYSSKTICRHYRSGQRKSCWLGSNCKFLHQD